MKKPDSTPIPMNLNIEKMDAELQSELSRNRYEAKLLRQIADYIDGRSYAQSAAVLLDSQSDAKAAIAWLIEARRDISSTLKLLVLCVALESKESEHFRGLAK